MRRMIVAVMVAMLGGCVMAPITDRPPTDRREPVATPRDGRTPVERWTDRQRDCEVGDRKKQRRCPMEFPGGA